MRELALVIVSSWTSVALAGECAPDCEGGEVANLEQRAARKDARGDKTFDIFIKWNASQLPAGNPKLAKRAAAACDKILDVLPDDPSCVDVVAQLGLADVGKHDIVAALERRGNKVTDVQTISDLAQVHSPRAEPVVIAHWKELAAAMAGKERNADAMNDWAAWRNLAAQALAAGTGDARAFLADQVATPKLDRGVRHACQAAIDAIDKRARHPK
jgi:hypothetical protein